MQIPLQITFHGIEHSPELEDHIRASAAKLEQFHPHIMSCRVTVGQAHRHRHQGRQFSVNIEVRAPAHQDVVATLHHHEDVYVALRDAFDAARRMLEDDVREARGDVKLHETPQHGKVARVYVDEGYGFIATDDGRELYFGRENVVHPPFEHLMPDDEVQFIEEAAAEGPQAHRVSIGKHGS